MARSFGTALADALKRREEFLANARVEAFRAFSADADGVSGVFVDVYGPGAVLIVHEGKTPRDFDPHTAAADALTALRSLGVRAIYVKRFAKDRSRLGGELPADATSATPATGEALPEFFLVHESKCALEVRLYDGLSTGLFLDQRANRKFVAEWVAGRAATMHSAPAVLNTFAYTCAFSVAAARAGAIATSVDVSSRYLEWGKRNFTHNGIDIASHRFAKMDTFEFFGYARRKNLTYDLIVLDPPSFGSGSKSKGIRPWSAVSDYARLVKESAALLNKDGLILASTNTLELCRPGKLQEQIIKGLGRNPRWVKLPEAPADFANERERFAARAFTL